MRVSGGRMRGIDARFALFMVHFGLFMVLGFFLRSVPWSLHHRTRDRLVLIRTWRVWSAPCCAAPS